jgi:hypothetical protein
MFRTKGPAGRRAVAVLALGFVLGALFVVAEPLFGRLTNHVEFYLGFLFVAGAAASLPSPRHGALAPVGLMAGQVGVALIQHPAEPYLPIIISIYGVCTLVAFLGAGVVYCAWLRIEKSSAVKTTSPAGRRGAI